MRFQHLVIDAVGPLNPHIKVAGDLNGDGRADVVVASSKGGPLVWYEAPHWEKHVIAPAGGWSTDAALADVDGDGDLDIVISDWYTHGRLEWYENPAPRGHPASDPWIRRTIGPIRAHDVEVGDLDGDGQLEIATRQQGAAGNQIVVWKPDGSGGWWHRILPCPAGEGLALGDLNGDGRLDLVIGGWWYQAPRDLLHDPWTEHRFADWPIDAVVKVADLNGDGRQEVLLTRSEGPHHVAWFAAPADPGSGLWTEHRIDEGIAFAHSLAVGDVDHDGEPDVVIAEMHQSPLRRVILYRNGGGGLRWDAQVIATTGSHNLCLADTSGDGKLDLVGANWSGEYQAIEMWKNLRAFSLPPGD